MRGSFTDTLFCLLAVVAGVSVSLQQVLSARLRAELGSPWCAGLVSFLDGSLVMLTVAVATGESLPSGPTVAGASWTSGVFGAVFVGVAILVVPRLGATAVVALVVVGQMLGSLAFDHFCVLGLRRHAASPIRLVGAALLITGVVLVR